MSVAAGVEAVLLPGLYPASSEAAPVPSSDVAGPCTPLPMVSSEAINGDGTRAALPTAATGMRYQFSFDGGTVSEVLPPVGWSAAKVSAVELHTYGVPARPTSPVQLSRWEATWGQLTIKKPEVPGYCVRTDVSNGLSSTSPNWSGYADDSITNKESVYGAWFQTAYDNVCTGPAEQSTWVGFGGDPGYGSHTLAQAGTNGTTADLGHSVAWWEVIDPTYDQSEIDFSGSSISGGDGVEAAVDYSNGEANFGVGDFSSGQLWSTGFQPPFAGQPMSNFFDTGRALTEWINERPQIVTDGVHGSFYQFLKSHLGNTEWTYALSAVSNGAGGLQYFGPGTTPAHGSVTMLNSDNGDILDLPGSLINQDSFYNNWNGCV